MVSVIGFEQAGFLHEKNLKQTYWELSLTLLSSTNLGKHPMRISFWGMQTDHPPWSARKVRGVTGTARAAPFQVAAWLLFTQVSLLQKFCKAQKVPERNFWHSATQDQWQPNLLKILLSFLFCYVPNCWEIIKIINENNLKGKTFTQYHHVKEIYSIYRHLSYTVYTDIFQGNKIKCHQAAVFRAIGYWARNKFHEFLRQIIMYLVHIGKVQPYFREIDTSKCLKNVKLSKKKKLMLNWMRNFVLKFKKEHNRVPVTHWERFQGSKITRV